MSQCQVHPWPGSSMKAGSTSAFGGTMVFPRPRRARRRYLELATNICGVDGELVQGSFMNDLTHCHGSHCHGSHPHGSHCHAEPGSTQTSVSSPRLSSGTVSQTVHPAFSHENVRVSQLPSTGPKLNSDLPTPQLASHVFFILGSGTLST